MTAPEFWSRSGPLPRLLDPLGRLYGTVVAARLAWSRPWCAPIPVICVGNIVLGGAGKTPTVLSLARILRDRGRNPHLVSRGYGGTLSGPLRVDPARHTAREVGDEPLLLAEAAPSWIGRDRPAAMRAAIAAGADVILLDDGFQNPSFVKHLSLLVVDGTFGLGNGKVFPAGPLREPFARGIARAQALVLIGEDRTGIERLLPAGFPLFRARLAVSRAPKLAGCRVLAFAGIGRPEKFYATLREAGAEIVITHDFPDHYPYEKAEIRHLLELARSEDCLPVTTAKDRLRLPRSLRDDIAVVEVVLEWDKEDDVVALLDRGLFSPGVTTLAPTTAERA
jgi:tetraacyldisaccharide 4'-kinase